MGKKCIIAYASITGNTEKVADRIRQTFEKHGWECDSYKVDEKVDLSKLPFDFKDYDFACIGSGVRMHTAYNSILSVVRKQFFGAAYEKIMGSLMQELVGLDPAVVKEIEKKQSVKEEQAESQPGPQNKVKVNHGKVYAGSSSPKAVVFVTYAGYELGPKEALPALEMLSLEIEHLGFECIGKFCCPGQSGTGATPETYHGDIRGRPDERDLLKAEMFVEEKLEAIAKKRI